MNAGPTKMRKGSTAAIINGIIQPVKILCICLALVAFTVAREAQAYTVIIPSTAAPAGTEQALIAQTTTYFNAVVTPNPLFPNTYRIDLYGPAVSQFTIIKDSGTYAFIYGEGEEDERQRDIDNMVGPDLNCDASSYCLNQSTITAPGNYQTYGSTYTVTLDTATCQAIVCRIAGDIYLQNFTPP